MNMGRSRYKTIFMKTIVMQIVLMVFLPGCNGDGGEVVSQVLQNSGEVVSQVQQTGVFLDGPVEGLGYVSGANHGVTGSDGSFTYAEGDDVTFSIGSVTLGKAAAKPIMTPLDLVEEAVNETHQEVVNIARFLQSLDTDGIINDSIAMSAAVRSVMGDASYINFDQTTEDFTHDPNVKAIFEALNAANVFTDGERLLVGAADATAHLSATLIDNPVITINSPNGKEFVTSVYSFEITWKANTSIVNVNILLSQDGGTIWNEAPIAESTPNSGSFWWDVPIMSNNNTENRIRIVDAASTSVYDDSNGNFTILLPMADLTDYILQSGGVDTDGDHLPNDLEVALGTDPNHPDSDRDGIRDYEEILSEDFGQYDNIPDLDQDGIIAALDIDDDGDGVHDGEGIDSDGDSIFNYLEINGFTYNWYTDSYALWDGVSFDVPYFKTDPRQLSTDQDPYSDDLEASGKLMDVLIKNPGDLPMVPAYPNIVVRLEGYDVTLNSVISYTQGGSLAEGTTWSRQTTVENAFEQGVNYEAGIEVSAKAGVLEWGEAKYSGKIGGSSTWSWSSSSTKSTGESITQESNWQRASSTNPATAGRVKLKLKVYNFGTAAASNILPTMTMKIGGMSVLTFVPSIPIGILEPGGVYPAQEGTYWVVDKRHSLDGQSDIDLTLDELRMLESGAPLNIEVTQMDGDVMLLSDEGQWEFAGKWGEYIARCEAVSANIKLDIGNGNFIHQLVYADDSESSPVITLGDALRWVASYQEWSDSPTITYLDRSGLPQDTRLTDWNFIFDNATLLENGIVPGDAAASVDIAPTEMVLGPDTTITARAPRETLGLLEPEIYFAFYDFDAKSVKLAAADYNGIVNAFFIEQDGTKHPMNETMPGTGVFTLDLTTIEGGYEPLFNDTTEIDSDLYEHVEVVNRDGVSQIQNLHSTFSPTRSPNPIKINSVALSAATNTLTANIDFDEYFPPKVKVYLSNGAVKDMVKHPMYWDPDHDSDWQYDYATDNRVPSDLKGALVIAEVATECNVEPRPEINGESNCFAVIEVPENAISDGSCGSGEINLSGYFTDTVFAGQIAHYDVVDFNTACEAVRERVEEEVYWSGFQYDDKYDLALKPLDRTAYLDSYHGANQVTTIAYEDINAGNIKSLTSPDGTGGHNFFSWSTPIARSTEGPDERQSWVITTSDGRYVKIYIEWVKEQHIIFTTHSIGHAKLYWAIYE
jgi:hypothetical protein